MGRDEGGVRHSTESQGWLHAGLPRRFAMKPSNDPLRGEAARFRQDCRRGLFGGPTCGKPIDWLNSPTRPLGGRRQAPGFVQVNVVGVPQAHAFDFLQFALRNSRACPLLDICDGRDAPQIAAEADLTTDLPKYRVLVDGVLDACPADIQAQADAVAMKFFLLGCSFTWEDLLHDSGFPVRHIEEGRNVPMYRTNIPNWPAGPFGGNMVVSMRPYRAAALEDLERITGAFPGAHGGPMHCGDPAAIGISDLARPDYGDAVTIRDDEIPVFWACGVTPMEALKAARLELAVTHAPGHMLVTDILIDELRENGQ